jgi:DnaD/phage-associated family protein
MGAFKGFSDSETFSSIPEAFFRQLLGEIEDLVELKVSLHALWLLGRSAGNVRFLREKDFLPVAAEPGPGLALAVRRGTLLEARPQGAKKGAVLYFLNSPRGRAAAQAYAQGTWQPGAEGATPPPERPNLFRLYEENVGPLTPLIADALKDAEQTYPPEWVAEALEIAVTSNKRNWKYVEAILRRWKEEGHAKEQDRRDAQEPRGRDVTRKVEDFLKR